MSDIQWTATSATLSHKNGAKEFGLTSEMIHYQIAHAHGNPYYRLVREELESLVLQIYICREHASRVKKPV